MPGYTGICQDILEYAGIYWDMPEYTGICQDVLEYAGMYWNMLGYTGIYCCRVRHMYTEVYCGILGLYWDYTGGILEVY